jgi:hypothetical protein
MMRTNDENKWWKQMITAKNDNDKCHLFKFYLIFMQLFIQCINIFLKYIFFSYLSIMFEMLFDKSITLISVHRIFQKIFECSFEIKSWFMKMSFHSCLQYRQTQLDEVIIRWIKKIYLIRQLYVLITSCMRKLQWARTLFMMMTFRDVEYCNKVINRSLFNAENYRNCNNSL